MKGKFSGKALSRLDKLVRLQLRGLKMTRVPLSIKNKVSHEIFLLFQSAVLLHYDLKYRFVFSVN